MLGVLIVIPIAIALIVGVAVGFTKLAQRGYTMPLAVCLVLIIAGVVLVLAPTAFSFVLRLFGRDPLFTHDERTTCWVAGTMITMLGIFASIFSRR